MTLPHFFCDSPELTRQGNEESLSNSQSLPEVDLAILERREHLVKEVFKLKNYDRDTLSREFKH